MGEGGLGHPFPAMLSSAEMPEVPGSLISEQKQRDSQVRTRNRVLSKSVSITL